MSIRSRRTRALLLTLLLSSAAPAQQFWISGIPVNWMNKQLNLPPNDYMEAFAPNAPWQQGLAKVSVVKVTSQLALFGSDEQIRTVFDFARRHNVKMAMEMGAVVRFEGCGGGEGYAPPGLADKIGKRLQSLGLTLDIMAFDEPVWFAHEDTWDHAGGAASCAYPLPKVAHLVGISAAAMRRYFPAIAFGDIEPITPDRTPAPKLVADYVEFARLMQQETGKKMAFFHADIAWRSKGPWVPVMAILKREMNQAGIPVGAVIGGTPSDRTESAWTQTGLSNLATLNQALSTSIDQIVIQSWQPFPTRMLPENKPGTETFLLLQSEKLLALRPHAAATGN